MDILSTETRCLGGAVVVFAKCPIVGASKTRLAPLLGREGAASLAKAMLSDVLVSLTDCPLLRNTLKVLAYAPGTAEGESKIVSILQSLHLSYHKRVKADNVGLSKTSQKSEDRIHSSHGMLGNISFYANGWVLLPMASSAPATKTNDSNSNYSPKSDLTSSSLGDKLEDALERTRKLLIEVAKSSTTISNNNVNEAVLFLGMDSPELPMEEIVYGLEQSSGNGRLVQDDENNKDKQEVFGGKAHMCPTNDGGYGLLSVPKHAPSSKIFSRVAWSSSLTAVSQLKALTDVNVNVSIGRMMYDVDEPNDVRELAIRLIQSQASDDKNAKSSSFRKNQSTGDSLTYFSSGISTFGGSRIPDIYPHYTANALLKMNVHEISQEKTLLEE